MFNLISRAQVEPTGHPAGIASGIVTGTQVATDRGWRAVEGIVAGDRVLTFDGGLQAVTSVTRSQLWTSPGRCPRPLWPLRVPAGTLGNTAEVIVLPEQAIMIEDDAAEETLGDPFALVPAAALQGFGGTQAFAPTGDLEVIALHFATDEVVFADQGMLFLCTAARRVLSLDEFLAPDDRTGYAPLPMKSAEALIGAMESARADPLELRAVA